MGFSLDFDEPINKIMCFKVNLIDFIDFLDDNGIFTSVQEVFIKPKIEDHGKQVKCEASIKDNENVTLYNAVAATEAFELDIKFPPQPSENQTLNANKGKEFCTAFCFAFTLGLLAFNKTK